MMNHKCCLYQCKKARNKNVTHLPVRDNDYILTGIKNAFKELCGLGYLAFITIMEKNQKTYNNHGIKDFKFCYTSPKHAFINFIQRDE